MVKNCENWLGLVNSCIYYARQIREINQALLPGSFAIHWLRQYLVNVVLFGIKDP